ncbi:MAG: AAA family ATPase, partial [Thermodesulfobacteriota bacterium]|nr:AAA family ATPase [Thermodesulfobacteriota bacterium]
GLLVKYLVEKGKVPVLAVDADSNANFNEVLGLKIQETLGDAREEMKKNVSIGMTKDVFMEMKLEEAVIEAEGFDLIVMGRPEGAGCYCAANTLLTKYLDRLMNNYSFVVIDNEAGMEHISRLTTNNIDTLLIISDPSRRSIQSAERILELTNELGLNIENKFFIVNQVKEEQFNTIKKVVDGYKMDLRGIIPEDIQVRDFDLCGRPTTELNTESNALKAAYQIFDGFLDQ